MKIGIGWSVYQKSLFLIISDVEIYQLRSFLLLMILLLFLHRLDYYYKQLRRFIFEKGQSGKQSKGVWNVQKMLLIGIMQRMCENGILLQLSVIIIRHCRRHSMKRQKFVSKLTSTHHQLYQLEQGFKQACLSAGEPLNYCTLFLRSLNNNKYESAEEQLRVKGYILTDETALLKKGESFSQHMSALLAEREQIIKKLRSDLILNRSIKQLNLNQCCEKIEALRLYNLIIIENLVNLTARLKIQSSEYCTEIIRKIVQGTDFLRFTLLRKHIEFSNSDDPLFLIPLKKFRNLQLNSDYNRKPVVDLFCIGEEFRLRLEAADGFIKNAGKRSLSRERIEKQEELDNVDASQSNNVFSSQATEKVTGTLQKFMLPSILSKAHKRSRTESKDSDYSHLSGMIRRLAEKQATDEKLKRKESRLMFLKKKRSSTQAKEYPLDKEDYKFNMIDDQRGRRLKTMGFADDQEQIQQSYISRSSTNKQYKLTLINNSQISIPNIQPEITKKNEVYNRQSNLRHNISSQKSNKQYRSSHKNTNPLQLDDQQQTPKQSSNRIKKQRKKRAVKTIQQDKCRETIWNEVNQKKQEIFGQQSTQSNLFRYYHQNTKKQFSPQIQDRIIRIELLSGITQKAKRSENHDEEKEKRNIRGKNVNENDSIRYKNPFDQLHQIRFYKRNYENQISQHYQDLEQSLKARKDLLLSSIASNQGRAAFSESKQSSYITANPINTSQQAKLPNKNVQNKSVNQSKNKNADHNAKINNGQSLPLKTNVDASTNTARQVTFNNLVVKQLDFQQVNTVPHDQKMNMTFSKGHMKDYVESPNKVIFDQTPQQSFPKMIEVQPRESLQTQQFRSSTLLQKCKFQSKAMKESELLQQLRAFNKQNYKFIEPFLTTNYFKNRHIILTNCIYNQQIACYCLYYPYLTNRSRFVFILHLEFQEKYAALSVSFVNTFIKYIFCNDPTDKIIFLKHKQLFQQDLGKLLQSQENYMGEIKTPIKGNQLAEKSYYFERKQLKCNKQQEFPNIFESTFLFATTSKDESLSTPKTKDIYFSSSFLKKLQSTLKKRQAKSFLNYNQLESYLEQQNLPLFTNISHSNEIFFTSQFFEDCLINIRYFVYSKYFYFTVQPPYTYLYQNDDVYYLLLSTSVQKKYFILADKIYEETQHVNIYQNYRENVLNRKIGDIFGDEKRRGAIVGCPQFKKQVQFAFSSTATAIINFSLNWKQYIKGVRYFPQDKVDIELIGPFFCGLVELDESNTIKQIYSTNITLDDIVK